MSVAAVNPTLAGKDAAYIKEALTAYKNGTRANVTMKVMASGLSEAEIDNIAVYVQMT